MSNDIYKIVERLAVLEGRITPTDVKHGLNQQQKSVKQLPALFKPKDISPTLSKPPYQKHPMDGWLVGEDKTCPACKCDPCECDKEELDEAAKVDEEKLLDKVKKSLIDYLESVEETLEKKIDRDLGEKPADRDIGKRAKDKDLVAKVKEVEEPAAELAEDPTQEDPVIQPATPPISNPTYAESAPVKSITMEDGALCEIHGDMHRGFEVRHGNRSLKSRFKTLEQAEMAIEMYRARCRKNDQSQDYMEER